MFKEKSCEFVNFLKRTDTEEYRKEKLSHEHIVSALESRLKNIIEEINYAIFTSCPQIHDDGTSGKTSSKGSIQKSFSSKSTLILRQRARAEAIKAMLEFTKKKPN